MPDILLVSDQEKRIKSLKRRIETWRVFLVALYSVLIWTESWYPCPIVGTISTVFLMYWYWNPPIITSVSLFFMMLSLFDYSVPRICSCISQPHQWTALNEKKFEIICETLVKTQDKIYNQMTYFIDLKRTNPKMYFLSLFSFCSLSAWIGYTVNNWLICFILVTLISLYPGVKHNEVLSKFLSIFLHRVTNGIRSYTEKDSVKNK
ncbi:hypothetical protein DAPPUDRAFT_311771 [Daphnia pulex]|uniref:ADP-ribosylation factor-like protein 6-interacting protein 1 n=1 Tax=Daphnia pulex TaxID=6669 RepID=E9FXV4_DAPPU|nr:hypothetical protein DAPPUDRAFT_311771 [Daphnia pulex]|eukprot:EFX88227.1 hypothetical protein DAPPUDRAFT_311771 [Daphnia pulex]